MDDNIKDEIIGTEEEGNNTPAADNTEEETGKDSTDAGSEVNGSEQTDTAAAARMQMMRFRVRFIGIPPFIRRFH